MEHRTKAQIRKNMQSNKGNGTRIEMQLALAMWHGGIRYRKNPTEIFGKPDFRILPLKSRIVVFCDGEFWHGYNWEERKNDFKTNQAFWISKIERNIQRDQEVTSTLKGSGWIVIRFSETDINLNYSSRLGQRG